VSPIFHSRNQGSLCPTTRMCNRHPFNNLWCHLDWWDNIPNNQKSPSTVQHTPQLQPPNWGAVAYSWRTNHYRPLSGKPGPEIAIDEALQMCTRESGFRCYHVTGPYFNKWIAVAWSEKRGLLVNIGQSEQEAKKNVRMLCRWGGPKILFQRIRILFVFHTSWPMGRQS
jgi:hypothetical protein